MRPPDLGAHGRNGWVDVFRGAAAIAVALYHFNVVPTTGAPGPLSAAWRWVWAYGYLGVPVFFALSGYCVGKTWLKSPGAADFARRRARRILPPYWACVLLVIALAFVRRLATGTNDIGVLPRTPGALLATAALATYPVTSVPAMNWVYWTLYCEAIFYALLALALMVGGSRVAVLAGLHGALCVLAAVHCLPDVGPLLWVNCWPAFGVGAALAVLPRHRPVAAGMLAAGVLPLCGFARHPRDAVFLAVAFATTGLVHLTARRVVPGPLVAVERVGEFSYSLYLVHVPIGALLLLRLFPGSFGSDAGYLLRQLGILAGVLVAARLFFVAVERPFAHLPKRS
jgi:peptidoglycan/LPS O-acetylase OafA/YrhL